LTRAKHHSVSHESIVRKSEEPALVEHHKAARASDAARLRSRHARATPAGGWNSFAVIISSDSASAVGVRPLDAAASGAVPRTHAGHGLTRSFILGFVNTGRGHRERLEGGMRSAKLRMPSEVRFLPPQKLYGASGARRGRRWSVGGHFSGIFSYG